MSRVWKPTRMDEEQTRKFIRLLAAEEVLWNSKVTRKLSNMKPKREARLRIAAAMNIKGLTEDLIDCKIRSLRCSYATELRRFCKSQFESDSVEDWYMPQWLYFDMLDPILRPHIAEQVFGNYVQAKLYESDSPKKNQGSELRQADGDYEDQTENGDSADEYMQYVEEQQDQIARMVETVKENFERKLEEKATKSVLEACTKGNLWNAWGRLLHQLNLNSSVKKTDLESLANLQDSNEENNTATESSALPHNVILLTTNCQNGKENSQEITAYTVEASTDGSSSVSLQPLYGSSEASEVMQMDDRSFGKQNNEESSLAHSSDPILQEPAVSVSSSMVLEPLDELSALVQATQANNNKACISNHGAQKHPNPTTQGTNTKVKIVRDDNSDETFGEYLLHMLKFVKPGKRKLKLKLEMQKLVAKYANSS